MLGNTAMRQIGVKNMGFRVEIMEWSNKMDLIAFGNDKGEVIIQRLNWQKICTFPSPGENIKIRAISWQPDGKIIAAGYSSGKVALLDVEKEDEIYSFHCGCDIKTMNWTKTLPATESDIYSCDSSDSHEIFLANLPSLSTLSSSVRKNDYNSTKIIVKDSPTFLVISLKSGEIYLSVFGVLPCGSIDMTKYVKDSTNFEVCDVRMGCKLNELYIFVRDENKLNLLIFKNDILQKYMSPLLNLAIKYGHILELLNYINDTIQGIIEAWETVVLEMDNKLTKYANSQVEGSLSADFLELLMFGCPSIALENFLTRDLTEKGLKKLGNSIELSYYTIQNLIVKPLHSAAINLFFHLNVLKGLSRNTFCYKALLSTDSTEKSIKSVGAFLVKILELQQTVDISVYDYKTFWCWLYVAIVRLMEETVPDDVASVTQEDITYLAEFLNNFDDCIFEKEDGTIGKRKFNLERVGQYLENRDLQFPTKFDGLNQWNKLLEENECLRDSGLLFPHNKNCSLIQEHNQLKKCIHDLFSKPNRMIEQNFILTSKIECAKFLFNPHAYTINTSYTVDENNSIDIFAASINEEEVILIESQANKDYIKCCRIQFTSSTFKSDLLVKHLQFYNPMILSILLHNTALGKSINYFVQLPLNSIRNRYSLHQWSEIVDLIDASTYKIFDFMDTNQMKSIEGLNCSSIAVSGSRKVASVLSDNYRKIRIYEMEVEEDDDEIDMSQNQNLDNSKESVQSQE